MKILFVWSGLTGYMGAGWRRLSEKAELKVSVDVGEKTFGGRFQAEKVMAGIDWSDRLPEGWRPDVVFVVGWHNLFAFRRPSVVGARMSSLYSVLTCRGEPICDVCWQSSFSGRICGDSLRR